MFSFQSTCPIRGATLANNKETFNYTFQSTRPMRGATQTERRPSHCEPDFNPRAPYEVRHRGDETSLKGPSLSFDLRVWTERRSVRDALIQIYAARRRNKAARMYHAYHTFENAAALKEHWIYYKYHRTRKDILKKKTEVSGFCVKAWTLRPALWALRGRGRIFFAVIEIRGRHGKQRHREQDDR